MWTYEKKLQYPVRIKTPNARTAKYIISQLGGPDGELAASLRYMHQRYTAKPDKVKGVLTDIATEELAHVEMISAILYQLTDGLTPEQIKEAGFDAYFVDHTLGLYPQSAAGVPFTAAYFQSKGCLRWSAKAAADRTAGHMPLPLSAALPDSFSTFVEPPDSGGGCPDTAVIRTGRNHISESWRAASVSHAQEPPPR